MRTAVRACLGLLAISFVVLTSTGTWLWFRYQPDGGWIGDVHQVAATLLVALCVAAFVIALVRRARHHERGALPATALLASAPRSRCGEAGS